MSQDQEPFESALDRALERPSGRYIVGIDLGTTNCAVAFVDTLENSKKVETFQVEQLVDWNMVEKRDTLPSFHYQLTERESTSLQHRWIVGGKHAYVVGILARDRGLQMPGRQVASAKSWLCHPGVDRTAPLLPWHGDEDVQRLSPVAASAAYLQHIRACWNACYANALLEEQDVVVTLPASFDEIARELTVEAAKAAGIPRVILLEEPQAAFYAWLHRHGEDWTKTIQTGQSILVCDIGGGTTDLTLIRVRAAGASEQSTEATPSSDASSPPKRLHRVAVGQHLILGGDNLDLALAKAAESMLVGGGQLPPRDWDSLRLHCRVAKEVMLGEQPPTEFVITLAGSGSKLLSQTRTVTIDQAMIKRSCGWLFSYGPIDARPIAQASGFQEFGLPYAQDAAVTKHLASFLWEHRFAGRSETECAAMDDRLAARPDFILFNGGVLEAERIKERIIEQLNDWFVFGRWPRRGLAHQDARRE